MPIIEYKLNGDSKSLVDATDKAAGSMGQATAAASALMAGTLALGAAYVELVSQTVAVVDQVNTLSKATGLSTETVNGLRLAAKASGKELTDLVPKNLAKNMMAARDGSKAMEEAFQAMGIEVTNADGSLRDANEVFGESVESLTAMDNATEAAALAAVVMGKQGRELLSAFDNQDGLERFIELGNEFGTKTGPDAVAAASAWQASTANLALGFENMGQRLLDVMGGSGAVGKAVEAFTLGMVLMTEFAAAVAEKSLANFSAVGRAIEHMLSGNFRDAAAAAGEVEQGIGPISEAFTEATERAFKFWEINESGSDAAIKGSEQHAEAIGKTNEQLFKSAEASRAAMAAERERAKEAKEARELELQFLKDMADLEAELTEARIEAHRAEVEERKALEQSRIDHQENMRDKAAEAAQERREAAAIAEEAFFTIGMEGTSLLMDLQQKQAEALEGASRKEMRAKRRALKRTFAANQMLAVTQIGMDAAKSILALIPSFAFLGPGAPAAAGAVVGPVAAIQTAQVLSQAPPSFHDGTANVDEVLATLRQDEAVLNQRGAESIGRERIERANRGEPMGGAMMSQIVFQGRVLDQMMSEVVQSGGKMQRLMSAGRAPAGTLDPFGGI